jgi:hypothetical protein
VDTTVLLLILIGVVCIVAAIIGGGFELPGIKVPPIQPALLRVVLGSVGVVVIGGALVLPGFNSPKATPSGTPNPPKTATPSCTDPHGMVAVAQGNQSEETARAELRSDGWYNVRTEPKLVHPGIPNDLVVEQTPTAGTLWCSADEVVIGVTK